MNIFELIEPINLSNQVKTDSLAKQKRSLSVGITRRRPAYSFMSTRMSTKSYNDNFIETPVTPQTRKNSNGPVNKSLASRTRFEIMVPDLNKLTTETDRYKFVMSASREVLDKIEPGMYFGIRVGPAFKPDDQQLIYDFDSNAIYRRVNNDYDSSIAYDPRNVYIMLDKNNYKNVFVDTKNYVPILHSQLISADDMYEEEEEEAEYDDLVPYNPGLNPREDAYNEEARRKEEEYRKRVSQNIFNQANDILKGLSLPTEYENDLERRQTYERNQTSQFQIPDAKTIQESHWDHDDIIKYANEQYEKEERRKKERMEMENAPQIPQTQIPQPQIPQPQLPQHPDTTGFNIPEITEEMVRKNEQPQQPQQPQKITLFSLQTPQWMQGEYTIKKEQSKLKDNNRILYFFIGNSAYRINYSNFDGMSGVQEQVLNDKNDYHGLTIVHILCSDLLDLIKHDIESNPLDENTIEYINFIINDNNTTSDPKQSIKNYSELLKYFEPYTPANVKGVIRLINNIIYFLQK